MEVKRRVILMRLDGKPCDAFYQPVESISKAARFPDMEAYERFINGYYKPLDPSFFYPQLIEVTYRKVEANEPTEN